MKKYYKFQYTTGTKLPGDIYYIEANKMYIYKNDNWVLTYTFPKGNKLSNDFYKPISKEEAFLEIL